MYVAVRFRGCRRPAVLREGTRKRHRQISARTDLYQVQYSISAPQSQLTARFPRKPSGGLRAVRRVLLTATKGTLSKVPEARASRKCSPAFGVLKRRTASEDTRPRNAERHDVRAAFFAPAKAGRNGGKRHATRGKKAPLLSGRGAV